MKHTELLGSLWLYTNCAEAKLPEGNMAKVDFDEALLHVRYDWRDCTGTKSCSEHGFTVISAN